VFSACSVTTKFMWSPKWTNCDACVLPDPRLTWVFVHIEQSARADSLPVGYERGRDKKRALCPCRGASRVPAAKSGGTLGCLQRICFRAHRPARAWRPKEPWLAAARTRTHTHERSHAHRRTSQRRGEPRIFWAWLVEPVEAHAGWDSEGIWAGHVRRQLV
jgi:hypothetical protein